MTQIIYRDLMPPKLIHHTFGALGSDYFGKTPDEILIGIARVSSGKQGEALFNDPAKLMRYLLVGSCKDGDNSSGGHISPFTTVTIGIEFECSLATAAQLLRHNISPQQLSFRYTEAISAIRPAFRKKNKTNRQGSNGLAQLNPEMESVLLSLQQDTFSFYEEIIRSGVSPETARSILPQNIITKVIISPRLRELYTMLATRCHYSTQKETRDICWQMVDILAQVFPTFYECVNRFENGLLMPMTEQMVLLKYGINPADVIAANGIKAPDESTVHFL